MPHRIFKPRKKHRSHASSLWSLLFANLFVLSVLLLKQVPVGESGLKVLGFATDVTLVDLYDQTNLERQQNGLSRLKYSPVLEEAAKQKAADMFANDYWAHISPSGTTPWDFFESVEYRYLYAGENLAKDFDKSTNLVAAWMNSPTHRENILNPNYTEIGFAIVNGDLSGNETTLVVQMFAKPEPGYISTTFDRPSEDLEVNPVTTESLTSSVSELNKRSYISINASYILYFAYFVLGFFAMSLLIDGVWAYKEGHLRLTGNTVSHLLLFVGSMVFVYYLHHPEIL